MGKKVHKARKINRPQLEHRCYPEKNRVVGFTRKKGGTSENEGKKGEGVDSGGVICELRKKRL